MASAAGLSETILYDTLVNYLISMARTVESAMNRALEAIVSVDDPKVSALVGEVFLLEPRINEMEIVIDEHAIRLLRRGPRTAPYRRRLARRFGCPCGPMRSWHSWPSQSTRGLSPTALSETIIRKCYTIRWSPIIT